MKFNKKFKKFYEVGSNKYYIFSFDRELYLGTESEFCVPRKIFKTPKYLTQNFKMLQLTTPILMLFTNILDMSIDKVDKDFPDMTTYKKLDNLALRKDIETIYKQSLDDEIESCKKDFDNWIDNIIEDESKTDEEKNKIIETNKKRLDDIIYNIKTHNVLNTLKFKVPRNTNENPVVRKMIDTNLEFLYTQKIGSNLEITYLYDLDCFGTLTIYKIQNVRKTLKSVETFIYNKEIIEELIAYIENNKL